MRAWLVLVGLLVSWPAAAEDLWVLQTGPEAVEGIPLDPFQPVTAWRGLYSDGEEKLWVYATESLQFFDPSTARVRHIAGTRWTVVAFFPLLWSAAAQSNWFDRWVADFLSLSTLPDPGWPIVFPAVLKKS